MHLGILQGQRPLIVIDGSRVLEIVPFAENERQASRVKFKTYRSLGLEPRTQEIN